MMKSIFIFLSFAIASFVSLAQSETRSNTNTNNSTNNNNLFLNSKNTELAVPALDSVSKESSFEKALKKEREKVKSAAPAIQSEGAKQTEEYQKDQTVSSSSAKYQSSSSSFKSVQYGSSHNPYSRSASPAEQKVMDESLKEMESVAPNTYETNLYNYVAGHYDLSRDSSLFRAAELQPESQEVRQQLGVYYFMKNDLEAADSVTTTLLTAGTFCTGQMNYSEDLYHSIQSNSTLIVHGFTDLLPIVHQMNTDQSGKTVEIVSLDLLQSDDYKASLSEKGFVFPESKVIDTAFLYEFVRLNADKNIQLSLTLPKEYFQKFLPDLYPVGLTFVVNKRPEDEEANVELWQKEWDKNILLNGSKDWSDIWSGNYLPALMVLKKHYEANGNTTEVKKINEVIVAVSKRSHLEEKTKKYTSTK